MKTNKPQPGEKFGMEDFAESIEAKRGPGFWAWVGSSIFAPVKNILITALQSLRFMPALAKLIGWTVIVSTILNSFFGWSIGQHAMKGLDADTRKYAVGIVTNCGNPFPWIDTADTCKIYLNEYPAMIAGIAPTHASIRAEMDKAHQIARAEAEEAAQ
jgi:hypothetical protein